VAGGGGARGGAHGGSVMGISRQRHGPKVDGASSRLGKLRWTSAQLLVVVTRPGARKSGPAMERHPQQRTRTASIASVLGGQWLPAWRRGSWMRGRGG
jgi:hypothetical protein